MKMLVYVVPLTGEFRVIAVDNPNNSAEANTMYERYLGGKERFKNKKDGKLLSWMNALWLLVNTKDDASYGSAIRSACDEFWRLVAKSHFRKENNEANDN